MFKNYLFANTLNQSRRQSKRSEEALDELLKVGGH